MDASWRVHVNFLRAIVHQERGDLDLAVELVDEAAGTLQNAVDTHGLDQPGDRRAWVNAIALTYVLVPETRKHWDDAVLRGNLALARAAAGLYRDHLYAAGPRRSGSQRRRGRHCAARAAAASPPRAGRRVADRRSRAWGWRSSWTGCSWCVTLWVEPHGEWEAGVRGSGRPSEEQADGSLSWPRAIGLAAAAVAVLGLAFAVLPDRIADALERRDVSSEGRDLVLLGWWLVAVVLVPWVLARLQRRGLP